MSEAPLHEAHRFSVKVTQDLFQKPVTSQCRSFRRGGAATLPLNIPTSLLVWTYSGLKFEPFLVWQRLTRRCKPANRNLKLIGWSDPEGWGSGWNVTALRTGSSRS